MRGQSEQSKAEQGGESGGRHLDLRDLGLLLPVPHCQHVVVAVVHNTEMVAGVLRGQTKEEPSVKAEGHVPQLP